MSMITIHIDGIEYKVNRKSKNLLETCLSLGLDIPYFCWHPALGSIGACRQCAVKQFQNEDDVHGRLIMSCMTQTTDGALISINDKEARQFRKNVIECMMINHPHDCPVCEEGGNCHLQDMTVMTNHVFRRYRFTKRTHYNQYLGPFISHEMNRCITCYRCVRFYKEYADGQDFGVYGMHDNIYFGRIEDGVLESEFSGNLIDICPTGVFTDKTQSIRYSRKWDMQFSPSICQQCSIGCNISIGERYGELRRIENRYNGNINHYFLCDRGRFGHGYVNLNNRPNQPIHRRGNTSTYLNIEQAIKRVANIFRQSKKIIGIGSSRASIESNCILRKLVGEENFYNDIIDNEYQCLQLVLKIFRESGIRMPTLREIELHDAIFILGEDITQTGARAALSIRQAIKRKAKTMASKDNMIADWHSAAVINIGQNAKYPLFITNIDSTNLDDIATWTYCAPIEDQARLGFAVAHAIDQSATAVDGLTYDLQNKVNIIARALVNAKKPLIISGTNAGSIEIIQAAANVAKALKSREIDVGITMIARAVNSIGLSMIGGKSLDAALIELEYGAVDAIIILENNLYYHVSTTRIDSALANLALIVVIDHQYTAIMDKAHFIFSAASFAEGNGTVVNNEGRAQRFFQMYEPTYYNNNVIMLDSWRWLYLLLTEIKHDKMEWGKFDHIMNLVIEQCPQFERIKNAAQNADFRIHGQKLARAPHCYSGRNAMYANISVHEPRQPIDEDTMFAFSMEGSNHPYTSRSQIPFVWAPGWNSVQAWNKFQEEIGGDLRYGDPGVRLIDISEANLSYFVTIPHSFRICENSWRVVPYYHLFGSDELSQRAPIFKTLIPQPYIKLSQMDANKLNVDTGDILSFDYNNQKIQLPLVISEYLASGQIGIPIGIFGIEPVPIGVYVNNLQKV